MRYLLLLLISFSISMPLKADAILIKNARIFNGEDPVLIKGHVVIKKWSN